MVRFRHGDLFEDGSEAIVNTVNCVGVMGKGVALQFKRRFPGNYKAYRAACARGEVRTGRMFVFDNGWLSCPKWIINFPTKRDWRENSDIDYIASGLDDLDIGRLRDSARSPFPCRRWDAALDGWTGGR